MRILLDENLPEGLLALRLKGLDNGRLYREVATRYELFFTKDRDFAVWTSTLADRGTVKVTFTTLPQRPQAEFVAMFVEAFTRTDWSAIGLVVEWPRPSD